MRPYFEYRHRVTFADTNTVGNVYFANYVMWQGTCRERFIAEKAPGIVARLSDDLALVTVSCACDFISELYALNLVSVRMSLRRIDGNRLTMDFAYYRIDAGPGLLVARGEQTVAFMTRDEDGLVPVSMPDELRKALDPYTETMNGGLDTTMPRPSDALLRREEVAGDGRGTSQTPTEKRRVPS
jgi:enediyne biosynthesis thioesterase